jgi:hypothetical protein
MQMPILFFYKYAKNLHLSLKNNVGGFFCLNVYFDISAYFSHSIPASIFKSFVYISRKYLNLFAKNENNEI